MRGCTGTRAHGLRRLVARPSVPSSGSRCLRMARPISGTDVHARRSGSHLRASRLSGWASGLQKGCSGSGTRKLVSELGTSHLFLLADGSRGEGLGVFLTPTWVPLTSSTRHKMLGVLAGMDQLGNDLRQWHALGWCCWLLGMGPSCDSVALASLALPKCTSLRTTALFFRLTGNTSRDVSVCSYSSHRLHRYMRAFPCVLDYEQFSLYICSGDGYSDVL